MNNNSHFTIYEIINSNSSEIIIKNNSTDEFLSIIPEYGARLKELRLSNGRKNISILKKINRIDSNDRDDIFTNAKLSPFAGRIKDGKYIFNNSEYFLPINYPEEGNACHGYVYPKKFSVIEERINSDSALCRLEYLYNNENEGYPFRYSVELTYKLTESEGIICTTKIVNQSDISIPLSDGWHHYFDLGINIEELELKMDVLEIIELDSSNIPTGNREYYKDFSNLTKIGKKRFDSCFKINSRNGKAITKLIANDLNIDLNIWQETGLNKYQYLVIYTPPDRKSIAVEPITSNINSFNNLEGLIVLASGENFTASFGISLNRVQI